MSTLTYRGYTIWPQRDVMIGWTCQIEDDNGEIVAYTDDLDLNPAIAAAYRRIDELEDAPDDLE